MSSILRKINALKEFSYFDNWVALLFERIMNAKISIYQKEELHFINDYRGGDTAGARHLLSQKLYNEFINCLLSYYPQIECILDIGANNGGFVLSLATQKLPLKRIVAIEFNYRTYLRLHFNLLYNFKKDIKIDIVNIAASGKDDSIFTTDNYGSTGLNIFDNNTSSKSTYTVSSQSFDTIYENYFKNCIIDIFKIDVEGAEYDLFYSEHIKNITNVRFIIIEIHDLKNHNKSNLLKRILSLGFELLISGNQISPDVFLFKNNKI
jgi:FkbM family methyltransferase